MAPRPGIVTTLLHPAPSVLDFFVRYHRALGFERLFLFFDDPDDPALDQAAAYPGVTAIPNDDALAAAWMRLRRYPRAKNFLPHISVRQVLNCEVSVGIAMEMGIDWLLHIDIDELFYSSARSAVEHFADLEREGIANMVYLNFEAVPESEAVENYFTEVSLFKKNPSLGERPRMGPEQQRVLKDFWRGVGDFVQPTHFLHYSIGKAAARVAPDLGMGPLASASVHRFVHWSDPRRKAAVAGDDQIILHYAGCGFRRFWSHWEGKAYRMRNADPHAFAKHMIRLRMRHDVEAGRELYRRVVMLRDYVDAFLANDIVCRLKPENVLTG